MKTLITILALLFATIAISQDSTIQLRPLNKNKVAALKAQDQTQPAQQDTSKHYKSLFKVQNRQDWTWWDYTKEFASNMWRDKPWLVILAGIFLFMGIWRVIKRFFE